MVQLRVMIIFNEYYILYCCKRTVKIFLFFGNLVGFFLSYPADIGKKPASALASRSLNFSTKSPASTLSYVLSVASALTSSYFKRGALASLGFVLGFPKMTRLLSASWSLFSFSNQFLSLFLYFNVL